MVCINLNICSVLLLYFVVKNSFFKQLLFKLDLIDEYPGVSVSCKVQRSQMFAKNYPIEQDHEIPVEDKIHVIENWFRTSFQLLQDCNLSRTDFALMNENNSVDFRWEITTL